MILMKHFDGVPGKLLELLESRRHDIHKQTGVSKLHHSLQTARLALEDKTVLTKSKDEDVVIALFHDVFGAFAPHNHGRVIAEVLRPYISDEAQRILSLHETFMRYHWYGDETYLLFKGDPMFEQTKHFCYAWDKKAFTKDYEPPILEFRPSLERIFTS